MPLVATPTCPNCHFGPGVPSPQFRSRGWQVFDCPSCRCSFIWPRPSDAELSDVYTEYGAIFEQRHPRLRRRRDDRYRDVLGVAERALGRTGTLLDVGCSTGGFLAVAKDAGWDPCGLDLDESAVRVARERTSLPVYVGSSAASVPGTEAFDVISMNHYIEHVREPGLEVAAAARRIRPGGLLLLRTPNGRCRAAETFGSLWTWFTPPTHLTYFRAHSFGVLAGQLGLSVEATRIWRGDGYSTPTELALVALRGLSGSTGFSTLERTRRRAGGARAILGLKLLDSSPALKRAFSRWDDSELMVLLRNPAPEA